MTEIVCLLVLTAILRWLSQKPQVPSVLLLGVLLYNDKILPTIALKRPSHLFEGLSCVVKVAKSCLSLGNGLPTQ